MVAKTLRLSKTDSVNSNNTNFGFGVEIGVRTKTLPYADLSKAVDAYEVYETERNTSDKFRISLTINPFCSNVLYNACTEVVEKEGSEQCRSFLDDRGENINSNQIIGKRQSVLRTDMVSNTEYSKESVGFTYHPGVDIFDNHGFRSKGFRVVCEPNSGISVDGFNTLADKMRYADGSTIKYYPRDGMSNPFYGEKRDRYMYEFGNTLIYEESVSANIAEDDGWFGFRNTCSVPGLKNGDSLGVNRIINNSVGCDFVDLYPDRTLFSFTPKYNQYRKRLEDNWTIVLTYPYDNFDKHPLTRNVKGFDGVKYSFGDTNALLLMSMEVYYGGSGDRKVLFRTYTKHGLKKGDLFNLYYSRGRIFKALTQGVDFEDEYKLYESPITVAEVGDYNGENGEYSFITDAFDAVRYMLTDVFVSLHDFDPDSLTNSEINDMLSQTGENGLFTFRINRLVSNIESRYYFRMMRRFPNFKNATTVLDKQTASDKDLYDAYYNNNAYQDGRFVDYTTESYRLAFSNTVYNDSITQSVVTDDVVTGNIVDNLGRPVTEVYYTIVKRNDGYKLWYKENNENPVFNDESITFSHCFGKLTSGVFMNVHNMDYSEQWRRDMLSDCHAINNTGRFRDFANGERSMSMEMYGYGNSEISFNDNIFIGDLVSYNDMECIEIEIGDMYHRFNTAQREYDQSQLEKKRYNFTVHEVMGNDFDNGGNNVISYTNTNHQENILPEGYCYKAHYKVRLGEFGPVRQGSHRTVIVQSAQPIHAGEILIKVICSFKHNLYGGNELYICDDINRIWYKSMVRDIIDDYTVLINPISNTETPYINWITTSEMLSAGTLKLRKKNYDIPDYAANILTNTFVWRDRLPNGDINNDVTKGMPFASGCFYIDTIVNFHLLRQDPFGYSGLRDIDTSQFYIGVHGEEYKKSAAFFVGNEKIVC